MVNFVGFNSLEQREDNTGIEESSPKDSNHDTRELLLSVSEESSSPSSHAKLRLMSGTALVLIGAIFCFYVFVHKQPKADFPLYSHIGGDIAELHLNWTNECGGYNMTTLNNFNAGWAAMQEHGWVFSAQGGHWSAQTAYRPVIANLGAKVALPNPHAYWGWDYPGNGVIRLHLHLGVGMRGKIILSIGNAWHMGMVQARWDHPRPTGTIIARVPPLVLNRVIEEPFQDNWNLTIEEFHPRGIIVINYVHFECVPSQTTTAPTQEWGSLDRSPTGVVQRVAGARWELKGIDCHNFTLVGAMDARPWDGTPAAVSDRIGCAKACLATASSSNGCGAFAYPDPGQGDPSQCKILKAIAERDFNICELGLDPSYWSYHVLTEKVPLEDGNGSLQLGLHLPSKP